MLKFNKNILFTLASALMLALVSCNSDEDFSEIITPPTSGETGGTGESGNPNIPGPVRPSNPDGIGYYRPKTSESNDTCNMVYEYMPAPGQFINELKTSGFDGNQTTQFDANNYAMKRIKRNLFVSLGAFGGYIVVGFDHSIDNTGGYDFGIMGNMFKNSSEPGVVWVMQDTNGDGLPNDTWYELQGSETGKATTIQDYEVTYYRPTEPGQPVKWTDNKGGEGEVDYLKNFHDQEYYYPLWIEEDAYTLSGTRLEARNFDQSGKGSYWVLPEYEWGYADNFSALDRPADTPRMNKFKISNAIDKDGKPVDLYFIDFVKVQSAVQSKSGWLGEVSCEVTSVIQLGVRN